MSLPCRIIPEAAPTLLTARHSSSWAQVYFVVMANVLPPHKVDLTFDLSFTGSAAGRLRGHYSSHSDAGGVSALRGLTKWHSGKSVANESDAFFIH